MSSYTETILSTKGTRNRNTLNSVTFLLACSVILLLFSGCRISIYHINRGNDDISKKDVYNVTYSTIIPDGVTAKITYFDKQGAKVKLTNVTGKWEKSDQYASGQDMFFKVTLKLLDTTPQQKVSSAITIDGKIVTEQIQTGKNVKFRVAFKLP